MSTYIALLLLRFEADSPEDAREVAEDAGARAAADPTGSVYAVDGYPPREREEAPA